VRCIVKRRRTLVEESEEEQGEPDEPLWDEFVPNPEERRAKAEQRMQSRVRNWRGAQAKDRDVVGV
jgi:hypothetical protein